jgi:hypothetical protein
MAWGACANAADKLNEVPKALRVARNDAGATFAGHYTSNPLSKRAYENKLEAWAPVNEFTHIY